MPVFLFFHEIIFISKCIKVLVIYLKIYNFQVLYTDNKKLLKSFPISYEANALFESVAKAVILRRFLGFDSHGTIIISKLLVINKDE